MTPASKAYLNGRGITDAAIERYGIDGDGEKIRIPIQGFNKYRTYPEKKYFYDKGFSAALFGLKELGDSKWCVLTEGELDSLRLASEDIPAVSGTGGAGTFKDEWVSQLPAVVFICYDTDTPGKENALKVHWRIRGSRIVDLPEGKDVTEYLQAHSRDDFLALLPTARTEPKPLPVFVPSVLLPRYGTDVEKARQYPIAELMQFNHQNNRKCPWHEEHTPSLHLYPDNRVYCFGCSKGGDAISVYEVLHGCSFKEAVLALQ